MEVIKVINLSKTYGSKVALSQVNLTVNKGQIVGLVGPNGAGKTTLLRLIAGLTPIEEGQIHLFSQEAKQSLQKARQQIGTLIEAPAFLPELTAFQNLSFYRIQRGVKDKGRVDEVLDLVGLTAAKDRKYKGFSLGMKQRLAIGLSLLAHPKLLLLDEPTNGLDPTAIKEVRSLLVDLAQKEDVTILISSHLLSELEQLADRFIMMDQGQLVDDVTQLQLQTAQDAYYSVQVDQLDKALALIQAQVATPSLVTVSNNYIQVPSQEMAHWQIAQLLVQHDIKLYHLSVQSHQLEAHYLARMTGGKS